MASQNQICEKKLSSGKKCGGKLILIDGSPTHTRFKCQLCGDVTSPKIPLEKSLAEQQKIVQTPSDNTATRKPSGKQRRKRRGNNI